MRIGIGILAVCGIVGLALGVGAADQPADGHSPLAPRPKAQYFSRGGKSGGEATPSPAADAAPPATKNYYKELFAAAPAALPAEAAEPLPPQAEPTEPVDGFEATGAVASAPKTGDVTHAQYNRTDATREMVQPVQGTAEETVPDGFAQAPAPTDAAPAEVTPATPDAPRAMPPLPPLGSLPPIHPANSKLVETTSAAVGLQSPSVSVQWVKHGEVNVGQECQCELVATNSGQGTATDVSIEALFPSMVKILGASPEPTTSGERLTWNLSALPPGVERRILIRFIATERGEMTTSALVRLTGMAAGKFAVEEPMLKLSMQGPEEVTLGDPASQIVLIANPGTGVAQNVTVEAMIPAGLEHPRGSRLAMNIGSLSPGETRQVRLGLAAVQGGRHTVKVEARGGAGGFLHQTVDSTVNVIAPSVKVTLEGPHLRYVGRNAQYRITVVNDGSAVSNNVRIQHKVPAGFQFVQADRGGKFDPQTQAVHWFVGRLEPGQTVQVGCELMATKPGRQAHVASASSEQGAGAEARCETKVEGTASLLLEIVDLNDPVEVGVETGYEVRVRNEGSAVASNVALSCELPRGVEFLAAQSPTSYVAEKGLVVFQSLHQLEPGKAAIYRVRVRGTQQGNHRFRARLTSESIQEPLVYEELTKFYGE